MRLTLRTKLMAIVGAAALAFLVLIATGSVTEHQVAERLETIQQHYVPRIGLRPQLEGDFQAMGRAFQDAAAAQDIEGLSEAAHQKDLFFQHLAAAGRALSSSDSAALRRRVEDYYFAADSVTRRLIAGGTGETLVDAIADMQHKRGLVLEMIEEMAGINRGELAEAFMSASRVQRDANTVRLWTSFGCMLLVLVLSFWISGGVLRSLRLLTRGLARFGTGDFSEPIRVIGQDELGDVSRQANEMARNLARLSNEKADVDWVKGGYAGITRELRGELEVNEVANGATRFLASYLKAPLAAIYYRDEDGLLSLLGQYATSGDEAKRRFGTGEGLVGEAAKQHDILVVANPPPDFVRVRSGFGDSAPLELVLVPLIHGDEVTGVLELALFEKWTPLASELLLSVRETLVIAIEVARARAATRALLTETRAQAARLSAQEEELRSTNEELQVQQEELRETNEALSKQAQELEAQRQVLEENNLELDAARRTLEQKADELVTISAYKSQFLANMSHELRTPLNSMLLLSNLLSENQGSRLSPKQVEYARTINAAGNDLLALINQVLDLAKIESGKQDIRIDTMSLPALVEHAEHVFGPVLRDKGVRFECEFDPTLPETIQSDRQRVVQVMNNLLGNATKFTASGQITLRMGRPEPDTTFRNKDLTIDSVVAISVRDTGVGIAREHQERIFDPFEQVEASADRRYGGTGLGLAISRQLAAALGGELQLESTLGEGSKFTLFLPLNHVPGGQVGVEGSVPRGAYSDGARAPVSRAVKSVLDDRDAIRRGDGVLLIIEDDPVFAEAFGDVIHQQGLKYLVADNGEAGLTLARERQPSGIILDVMLPGMDGWTVMDRLRADPATASIPVHFVSALSGADRGKTLGAAGFLTKPATRGDLLRVVELLVPTHADVNPRVLIVEGETGEEQSLARLLTNEKLEIERVPGLDAAMTVLAQKELSCLIIDLSALGANAVHFLRSIDEKFGVQKPPIILYAPQALSKDLLTQYQSLADAVILKEGQSTERLINEIRLFARRLRDGLGPRQPAPRPHLAVRLEGKKILVVDDDMRTVYALSAMLRAKGADVKVADNGKTGITELNEHPDVDVVLMDIMMPEMDGYAAIGLIRKDPRFGHLPIVALTAKAMKGDEKKCLEAGASHYLQKPVDADRLLELLHSIVTGGSARGSG